jgi:hypothetical protein
VSASEYIELEVLEIKAETEKALLFQLEDSQVWVPKSQIPKDDVEQYVVGDLDLTVLVSEWFASKEGLI